MKISDARRLTARNSSITMIFPPNGDGKQLRRPMSSVSGLNLLARIIWYRGKAKVNRVLHARSTSKTPRAQNAVSLPYELVEMIIVHLINDIPTLKACSLTCYSWYIITLPYIHHTFVLRGTRTESLRALSNRHARGLIPLTKEIRILPHAHTFKPGWFLPQFFSHRDSRHFFAFTDIQSLTVRQLDIAPFLQGLQQYFGHLSRTLRSLTLTGPRCTSMQLSYFISLFPNLDDISISFFFQRPPGGVLAPFSTPRLHGKLELRSVGAVEVWEHLATWGGLRFHSIFVCGVTMCVPVLLAACTDTLDTLQIELASNPGGYQQTLVPDCNLSRLKVLRSLRIKTHRGFLADASFLAAIVSIFRTITSPVFSELEFILWSWCGGNDWLGGPPTKLFYTLNRMYFMRPFKLAFLFVVHEGGDAGWGQVWRGLVGAAADEGHLSCFEYPPSIRICRE